MLNSCTHVSSADLSKHGEPSTEQTRAGGSEFGRPRGCSTDIADKTPQGIGLHTQLSHMQMSDAAASAEASPMRWPADRDAVRAIDKALKALKAEMARESAEFLARLNDLLVECQDAAQNLRALSETHHRLRYSL